MSTGEARQRWRLVLARSVTATTQRDAERAWEAGILASGLPWASATARDVPRIAFGAPLPVGVGGDAELLDLFLAERLPIHAVRAAIERVLPPGDRLVDLYDVWIGEPGLPSLVVGADYRVTLPREDAPGELAVATAVERLNDAQAIPIERRKGERVRTVDLRRLIDDLALDRSTEGDLVILMRLRHDPDLGNARPDDVLAALEAVGAGRIRAIAVVRERLRLADDALDASPTPIRSPAPI